MLRNRRTLCWLVIVLGIGSVISFLYLPFALTATTPPTPTSPAPAPEPSSYDPAVRQLLETTYLGHAAGMPDPGEPALVLQKYLEQNAHGYHGVLAEQPEKLEAGLAEWQELVQQYPTSRHALVGLAKHYSTKAQASGDIAYTRQAADAYIQVADLAVAHGRIRYTREISTLLGELGDRKGLDEVFGRMLAQPEDRDSGDYYLALVDYARKLAQLSDDRAWPYFEQAIDFHSENNEEAINWYAKNLLDQGRPQKALEVLETRLTSEQRVKAEVPAFLRKQAMEQAGLDTASAKAEIALIKQHKGKGPHRFSESVSNTPVNAEARGETSSALGNDETTFAAILSPDSRVSTIFAIGASASMVRQDAIFTPNGAMNDRWPEMNPLTTGKQLATLKWPGSNRAGLVRIGTNNRVYARYFNGSSWNSWSLLSVLPSAHYAVDIAAVVYANNQGDIFAVANDNCTIYSSHSVNGTTWGAWQWWGACGNNLTVALMPDGTGFAALRTTQANGYQAAVRYFNGSTWAGSWTGIGGSVNDLALLAYANPAQIGGIKVGLTAVGSDNCTIYGNNWNGSSWGGWFAVTSCFDKVSAFNTSDGGAYQLFIHRDTDLLYFTRGRIAFL